MAKYGIKVQKELQLNRIDVLRALEEKEDVLRSKVLQKKIIFISSAKSTKRKGWRSLTYD